MDDSLDDRLVFVAAFDDLCLLVYIQFWSFVEEK
jgi:hypothetical protein